MLFDENLLGRKYWTHTDKTTYIIRGIYVMPNQKPIVIGEYEDTQNKVTRFTTHRMEDVKFDVFPS